MKKYHIYFIFVFFLFLFPKLVEAKTYSLTMTVETSDLPIANAQVSIYRVGNINESGTLSFSGEFVELTDNLNDLTASETKLLASKLVSFIQQKNISALSYQFTNTNGIVDFSSLEQGIYLIYVASVTQESVRYDTSPTLLVIPIADQSNESHFQIESKTELVDLSSGENGSTVDSPSTYDAIIIYIILAVGSFICILVFLYFLFRKKKKNSVFFKRKDVKK